MRHASPILALCFLGTFACAVASGQVTKRDVRYSMADGTTLDVYAPAEGDKHPVVIWIHGGGWHRGDKANVQTKPSAFVDRGFVFVSINYRLHPLVDYKQQAGDVARAVGWVRAHAAEFGGAAGRIFLMGHSAGAHLAALAATDPRYLEAEELRLGDIQGVILLDGGGYDIPRQLELARLPRIKQLYLTVFGDGPAAQRDASPLHHVEKGKGIPPFLILHVADRDASRKQSQALAARLQSIGTPAKVIAAEDKTHATINRELGQPNDPPTQAVFEFLKRRLAELPR